VWSFVWGLSGLWSVVKRREWGPARELGTRAALIHVYICWYSLSMSILLIYIVVDVLMELGFHVLASMRGLAMMSNSFGSEADPFPLEKTSAGFAQFFFE